MFIAIDNNEHKSKSLAEFFHVGDMHDFTTSFKVCVFDDSIHGYPELPLNALFPIFILPYIFFRMGYSNVDASTIFMWL